MELSDQVVEQFGWSRILIQPNPLSSFEIEDIKIDPNLMLFNVKTLVAQMKDKWSYIINLAE